MSYYNTNVQHIKYKFSYEIDYMKQATLKINEKTLIEIPFIKMKYPTGVD